MGKTISVDSVTGRFDGTFEVSVEGDFVRFDFDELTQDKLRSGDLDDARMQRELISLVVPDLAERGHLVIESKDGGRQLRLDACTDQYPLASDPEDGLLSLAWETGPLFGVYDFDFGLVDGMTVREPIACWRAAAGTLGFASRLRDAVRDAKRWHLLNHEVVFSEIVYPTSDVWKAKLINDLGFSGPYRRVIEVGEEEYHRALPPLVEMLPEGGVLYRGGYQDDGAVVDIFPAPFAGVLSRTMTSLGGARGRGDVATPQGETAPVAVLSGGMSGVYVVRVEGSNPWDGRRDDEDPYRFGGLPDGELGMTTRSNSDGRIPSDVREGLYRELYNTVVRLHTRRCSDELPLRGTSSPFYSCVLEHIWCAFGRDAIFNRIRACRTCGKPYIVGGGIRDRAYCGDECRDRYKAGMRRTMRDRVKFCIREMAPGSRFTRKTFDGFDPAYGKELEKALEELRDEGWVIRNLGGRGPTYELVRPPSI